jgi:ubiquinone/menaquinone biosynthesis C-methylase UbiE
MGIYSKHILPKLVHSVCGQKPTMRQREKVVPLAQGQVLEIGIGSGLNMPFYDVTRVSHIWGLEPSAEMWAIAQKNARQHHLDAEFIQSGAESIPLENNCVDTVVMTYTLCTIPETEAALDEIGRVLKPGGKLIFCEHGVAPDESVRRWQNRLNPVWKKFSGGCNLDRPIPDLLKRSGFKCSDLQTMYLPGWKPASFNYWGTASH